MPTYILHGGLTRVQNEANQAFFKLMVSKVEKDGVWLGFYFAREDNDAPARFKADVERMKENSPERSDILYEIATHQNLPEQLTRASVIYFAGGNTGKLFKELNKHKNIRTYMELEKTYAGSSAGMYILGRDFFDAESGFLEGFGILPYGMVAHHRASEFPKTQARMSERKRPLLMLHETQFVVIEV